MPKYIIGLTGSLGSGCTTTANYLKEKGYKGISISRDILKPLADEIGKPFDARGNRQAFGNYARENESLRDKYKQKLLALVKESGDAVVIECFRNPIEIDFLRDEFPHFYLFALYAPKSEREKRKELQGETDFPASGKRDEGEENRYGQHVRKCVNQADIVIDNSKEWLHTDHEKTFYEKVDGYLELLEDPYREPSRDEMMMHLAYSVSLLSFCIQRQVGAVITDENHRVLSTGFNDVPRNSRPCIKDTGECYRKQKKKELFQQTCENIKYCPFCGAELKFTDEFLNCDPKTRKDTSVICNNCNKDLFNVISTGKELDYCRSLHAEENAILSNPFLSDNIYSKTGNSTIYTTTFPCMLCAKKIANSGIKRVVFVEPYPGKESEIIFRENKINFETFEGIKSLSFNWIFRKRGRWLKNKSIRMQRGADVIALR